MDGSVNELAWTLEQFDPGRASSQTSKELAEFLRRVFLILTSLAIYGDEFYHALRLTITSSAVDSAYTLAGLLLAVYGVGLIRAWELLGVNRFGVLSWLNPCYITL